MATLQKNIHKRHHQRHRQQQQQQQKQKQQLQQEYQQCRLRHIADTTSARIIIASTTAAATATKTTITQRHPQAPEETNLKQRTCKVVVFNVAGRESSAVATLAADGVGIGAKIEAESKVGIQTAALPPELPCHSHSHSQQYQRVNHNNEYTTTTIARSARTAAQLDKQQRRSGRVSARQSAKTKTCCCCNAIWRLDSAVAIMMTMLVVATVVISGNTALAAQRDSFKVKDAKGLSNNVNSIPNGAGNAVSGNGADTNAISSGNADGIATANGGTTTAAAGVGAGNGIGIGAGVGAGSITSTSIALNQTTATTTITTTTTTTTATAGAAFKGVGSMNSNNVIASGSLQKASGISSSVSAGNSGINRNAIEIFDDTRNGPFFDKAASKNVTALLGKTAYLNCRVKNLSNKTMLLQVSWVRHRDIHLLTVGRYTYTSDQRFRAIHQPQTEDWILQIKYPQHRDSGIYECQVSTTPHMSHYIHLNVVEPSTEIIGAPDLYIESGSTINLTCVILNSPEPPAYIFWNHNNAIINYDSPRGGVSVVTNKGDTTTSFLLIKTAKPSDSGLYQCNPSNAKSKSVTVHVLNGEFPAAMQRAGLVHHRMSQTHYLLVYLSMYLFTLAYVGRFMKPSLRSPQSPKSQSPTSPQSTTKVAGNKAADTVRQAVHCF